jgi:hypothetical protein
MRIKEITIIMAAMVALVFIISSVQAAEWGCCKKLKTGTPAFCKDDAISSECVENEFVSYKACSDVKPFCQLGTCVPQYGKMEACQTGKTKAECDAANGRWVAQDLNSVEDCKPGCCSVIGTYAKFVVGKGECVARAMQKWNIVATQFDKYAKFDTSISEESACRLDLFSKKKGCCMVGGDCKYEDYDSCAASGGKPENFYDSECSEIIGCGVTANARTGCGILPGTENDIYNFDSAGNQEKMERSCDFPAYACRVCGEASCDDEKEANTSVDFGYAYCKKISCDVQLNGSQELVFSEHGAGWWKWNSRDVNKVNNGAITLRHGEQLCYNFYGSFERNGAPDRGSDNEEMYQKSTGLQNQYIQCLDGTITVHGVDPTRNTLCVPVVSESGLRYTKTNVTNNWQKCASCGRKSSWWLEWPGDLVRPFFVSGTVLSWTLFRFTSGACDINSCEKAGDCMYIVDFKYTSGPPAGRCVPKYPPAGQPAASGACGGGGDDTWNVCDKEECLSLGDYQFQSGGKAWWVKGATLWLSWYPAIALDRLAIIPVECVAQAIPMAAAGHATGYFECFAAEHAKLVPLAAEGAMDFTPLIVFKLIYGAFHKEEAAVAENVTTEEKETTLQGRGQACVNDSTCQAGLSCRTEWGTKKMLCVKLNSIAPGVGDCIKITGTESECIGGTCDNRKVAGARGTCSGTAKAGTTKTTTTTTQKTTTTQTGTKETASTTNTLEASVQSFITQCRQEGKTDTTSLALCCKNKCMSAFPNKINECNSYCNVHALGGSATNTQTTPSGTKLKAGIECQAPAQCETGICGKATDGKLRCLVEANSVPFNGFCWGDSECSTSVGCVGHKCA